ncbi:MAG TPA: TylF/MycF/NovP-related O-methyltransferase [Anaerolineales bacterium]|nr:TylF/MycF/NovP-related O-methyltransferase [Anaerolineales bacterium]
MTLQRIIYRTSQKSLPVRTFIHGIAFHLEVLMLNGYKKDPEVIRLIVKLRRERDLAVTAGEAYMVYSLARQQHTLPGDMAEVGVYKGGTAKLICEVKGKTPLHLFDTFQGLPQPHARDAEFFQPGWYSGKLDGVQEYLQNYKNVFFYPGLFPATSAPVKNKKFSFVHLDVDLYQSMRDCLEFFHPRLLPGGVILAHDYQMPGVRDAISGYVKKSKARVIELSSSQCLVLKP